MSLPFSRSLRSLGADRSLRESFVLVVGAVLLGSWLVWALGARVSVYEVSEEARLEVVGGRHEVQAPVSGSVLDAALALGTPVEAGQILVWLDPSDLEAMRAEKVAEQKALEMELSSLSKELAAVQAALGAARMAERAAVAEAQAAEEAAMPEAELAVRRAAVLSEHEAAALVFSPAEIDQARTQASARERTLIQLKRGVARLQSDHRARLSDRLVTLQQLEREATAFRASVEKLAPAIRRLELAIDKRKIRAPARGVLGRIADLSPGAFVAEGAPLFTVVAENAALEVVAQFQPSAAVGRIAPGQEAQLRLHGFPWAQYGRVRAIVKSIGSEAPDGKLRVELSVEEQSVIPLQHGMAAGVEVVVEQTSPATLLLRATGKWLEPSERPAPQMATSPR